MIILCLGCLMIAKPHKAAGPPAHKLAPTMPEGTVLNDFMKGSWKLGRPVGSGGFGLIYLSMISLLHGGYDFFSVCLTV